jgi:hypothetical protein
MPIWKKNIFIRVIRHRMQIEMRTAESILGEYPSLAEYEKNEILIAI